MRRINASEFKAHCLAILDRVAVTGEGFLILKRGKEVARLVPVIMGGKDYPQNGLKGTVKIVGDIIAPVLPASAWEAATRP